MNKNEQINSLINHIGDLIKKQSENVLWEEPAIKLYIEGNLIDIDHQSCEDGVLTIRIDNLEESKACSLRRNW